MKSGQVIRKEDVHGENVLQELAIDHHTPNTS